jgi:putative peptidoglycan lipid II flippase
MGLLLLQTLLMAARFGTGHLADAFLIAETVHFFFLGVLDQNLSFILTPIFIEYREKGDHARAWHVASTLLTACVLGLLAFVVLLFVFAPQVVAALAPGLERRALDVTILLTRILAPLSLLILGNAFLSTLYFAHDRFRVPAWTTLIAAAGGPVALLLVRGPSAIYALAIGLLIGNAVSFLWLWASFPERRHLQWTLDLRDPAVRRLAKTAVPRALAVSMVQVNFMVDRFFASFLGPGYIAALYYGMKTVTTPVRLVVGPLGRALMPTLSRDAARQDHERIRKLLVTAPMAVAFVIVPAATFLVAFRYDLLHLVFERQSFDAVSTRLTAVALLFYSLGLVSYFLNPILTGTFFSFQDSRTPLRIAAFATLLNIPLDYLFMQRLGHGGIALATSLVVTINTFQLWRGVQKHVGVLEVLPVLRSIGGTLLAAGVMGLVCHLGALMMPAERTTMVRLSYMGAALAVGSIGYVGMQGVLNRPLLSRLAGSFSSRRFR